MFTTLDKMGRMVVPIEVRVRLSLQAGDELIVIPDGDGEFRVMTRKAARRKAQALTQELVARTGGGSLADELAEERRTERVD